MSRVRRAYWSALLIVVLILWGRPAAAQLGYLYFQQHVGVSNIPLAPSRLYVHQANGASAEVAQLGFPAGSYVLDSMEANPAATFPQAIDCRYMVRNVPFTIAAGKTTVLTVTPVPSTCRAMATPLGWRFNGQGTVWAYTKTPGTPAPGSDGFTNSILQCHIVEDAGHFRLFNPSRCEATLNYGDSIKTSRVPDLGSTSVDQGILNPALPDTIVVVKDGFNYYLRGVFQGPNTAFVGVGEIADLGIVRTGGQSGPFFNYSTFTVTNHGPNRAEFIQFGITGRTVSASMMRILTFDPSIGGCVIGTACVVHLESGQSMTLRVSAAAIPLTPPVDGGPAPSGSNFCSGISFLRGGLFVATDPNPANDVALCTQDSVVVSVAAGGHMPGGRTVTKGATDEPMLAFTLNPTAPPAALQSIALTAHGTGKSQLDITAVKLFADRNGNGTVDAADTLIASGTFPDSTGRVTLAVAPGYSLTGPTDFLVTYSFNLTIAQRLGGGLALAALPFLFLPVVRRRRAVLASLLLVVIAGAGVAACGGGSDSTGPGTTPPPGTATYQAELTGLNLAGVDVPGVSVTGPTVTITK